MQFKVPQNIDLEDKIVGPLTLIQFVYCLVGGLICYIIYQLFPTSLAIVFLIDLPVALITLAMAFLRIQDQPLSHFIVAGLQYFSRPKLRLWQRQGITAAAIFNAPPKVAKETRAPAKKIEKSDLEKLAQILDTKPLAQDEEKNFGRITQKFEKVIQNSQGTQEYKNIFKDKNGMG